MPDNAHDVGLLSLLINRVTQGFTVNGETLVLFSKYGIPLLQRPIDFNRVNPDEQITDDKFTGDAVAAAFLPTTTKALSGFRTQIIGPTGYGLVAAHLCPMGMPQRTAAAAIASTVGSE